MPDYESIIRQHFNNSSDVIIQDINQKTPITIKTDKTGPTIVYNSHPNHVYEVKTPNTTYIYKPTDSESTYINYRLAQEFLCNDCPVPKSRILLYKNVYFELYEKISGKTLSQAILDGMHVSQLLYILHQVLHYDYKISQIHFNDTVINKNLPLANKHKQEHIRLHGHLLAALYYPINKILAQHGKVSLHHCDLHPSNILLDDNNNVTALLDLGGISICDEYNMLRTIFITWPNISITQIADIFKSEFGYNINVKYFQFFIKFKQIRNKFHRNK